MKGEIVQVTARVEAKLNKVTGPGWTASLEGMSIVSETSVSLPTAGCLLPVPKYCADLQGSNYISG